MNEASDIGLNPQEMAEEYTSARSRSWITCDDNQVCIEFVDQYAGATPS